METQQPLTPAQEDYLEAVFELASGDTGAHVDAIAKRVGVHESTLTRFLIEVLGFKTNARQFVRGTPCVS